MSHHAISNASWLQVAHHLRQPPALLEGLDAWVYRWMGRWQRRSVLAQRLRQQAEEVSQCCAHFLTWDAQALQAEVQTVRAALLRDPKQAQGQLTQALALVGCLAAKVMGMQPYPVQFMGALALHEGHLAEMATGEGKTLTVGLAAVLAGWSGRPCHVVTANDYLAERDAATLVPLFEAAGLRVGSVHTGVEPEQRAAAYDADVVYVTPKELLADYLRDRLAQQRGDSPARVRLHRWLGLSASGDKATGVLVRGLHTAIVDEADSVFIDEAVTPLILATRRPANGLEQAVQLMATLAADLEAGHDYHIDTRGRSVRLLESAQQRLTALADELPALWRPTPRREELLRQALQVRCFFRVGQQYLVHEGEIVLLDEYTGRMTPGRTLTAGLHQAIEAFEGVEITEPNEAMSQMSFQAFFRSFPRLSGCSGTGWEASDEIWQVYGLRVVRIPTHRVRQTRYWAARWFADESAKWQAVADEVRQLQQAGRAVLVGVRSVRSSEALAQVLRAQGLPVSVLNAEAHAEEAQIVAGAGGVGCVTIATNMAGRGTDIRLSPEVAAAGGLHVVVAEVNDSGRIDRQLAGRCGRQGDPGSVSTLVCAEDILIRRYWPRWLLQSMTALQASSSAGVGRWLPKAVAWAQERSEADAFARRLSVLKSDEWMAQALPFAASAYGDAR